MPSTAVVMNMFYTGLGVARSLGRHGIPVIGLTSYRGIYGNFTRYATSRHCPDSRREPEALLADLLNLAEQLGHRAVIFPTRDDDILFLERYRDRLSPHFSMVIPSSEVVQACLDKWNTHCCAREADVPSPRCWMIETEEALAHAARDIVFPCVMKPVSAHLWRKDGNWQIVGGRKAIAVESWEQLVCEYSLISRADPRVLLQEMVPGGDQDLFVAACYLNAQSELIASFTAQKLLQAPPGMGTGCIVQTINRPELVVIASRILKSMRFTGIAEVEFKWDSGSRQFKLIEINARPWDQHILGNACGVDLIHQAYCEHAGIAAPAPAQPVAGLKWIAEDTFLVTALGLLWRRDPQLSSLFRLTRGTRIYAIWSPDDPLPFLRFASGFLPRLAWSGIRHVLSASLGRIPFRRTDKRGIYDGQLQGAKNKA